MKSKLSASLLICLCLAASAQETDIRRDATVNAVEQVMPSVVNIATKSKEPVRNIFDQLQRQMLNQPLYNDVVSQGSGVVIDAAKRKNEILEEAVVLSFDGFLMRRKRVLVLP